MPPTAVGAELPLRGFRMPQGCDMTKLMQLYLFDVVLKLQRGAGRWLGGDAVL